MEVRSADAACGDADEDVAGSEVRFRNVADGEPMGIGDRDGAHRECARRPW
jgi:hypothetical protein